MDYRGGHMPEAEGMLAADVSHDLHHYGRVDLHHAPGIRRTGLVHPLLSVPASSMQGSPHQFQPYPQKPPFLPQRPGSGSQVSPGKRKRKGQQGEGQPKRTRAKKPADAPTRPKSAYMFFLAEFREDWKHRNPESKKVADMAVAAGEAWRRLDPSQKVRYEELSNLAKAQYAVSIGEYQKDHPRPSRYEKVRDPSELKRPQSAYFFFLAEFRENFKIQNPGQVMIVKEMSKVAGEKWKNMTIEERRPYEELSSKSKSEYALLKTLTPDQRLSYHENGGIVNLYGPGHGMLGLPPAANSSPLGVVPDAMHDHRLHMEDAFHPHMGPYMDLSVQQIAQVPDIKQDMSYHSHSRQHNPHHFPLAYLQHVPPHHDMQLPHMDQLRTLPLDYMHHHHHHMEVGGGSPDTKVGIHSFPPRIGNWAHLQ